LKSQISTLVTPQLPSTYWNVTFAINSTLGNTMTHRRNKSTTALNRLILKEMPNFPLTH